jgi:hypothetical protein
LIEHKKLQIKKKSKNVNASSNQGKKPLIEHKENKPKK